MPKDPVLLAALFAPGSIESEVGKVQAALFSRHGLASAQALPPLIPIAFLDAARSEKDLLREMNAAVSPGWRIRLTGSAWVDGHLYACVESGGVWRSLRARAVEISGAGKGCLFPAAEGFYLGCGDVPSEEKSRIRPAVPEKSFTSGTIALLTIHAALDGADWWQELSWEVLEERPLRGRKAT
ncbi:MAG: hypothetical protein ABSG21_02880 [Spirochaetia bacterium]|jgi:hypothetical protein